MDLFVESDGRLATLSSRPTPRLLAVLPALEGRRVWLKDGGLRFEASGRNLEVLKAAFPEIIIRRGSGGPGQALATLSEVRRYEQKTAPYDHQKAALEKARSRLAFALFMEQGTGKTKVAIDRAGELWAAGKIDAALVVAKKGVHRQWIESQLPEHFGGDWQGGFWRAGVFTQRGASGMHWRAINYDAVKTGHGRAQTIDFVRQHAGRIIIIADETQEIKNPSSARHKALEEIKRLSRTPYRLALTGTPIARDLSDEWAQLRWLDDSILGIRYQSAFRAEYCIMGGFEMREIVAHKNLDRFKALVAPAMFRASKDVLGLPPKVYRRWAFDLSAEQRRAIRALKEDLIARLDSGDLVDAPTAAAALVKIQQVSNGFALAQDGAPLNLATNPRLEALMEVADAYPGKTIIWFRFRHDAALIRAALSRADQTFVEYHGGTAEKERAEAVRLFLAEGGPRFFLSNPQAGGTGLNLQGLCRHAIYYSNSFSAIDRWQSEDRIHRIGTNGSVSYTDLVAKGGIDAAILSNLKRKRGISDLALGEVRELLDEII